MKRIGILLGSTAVEAPLLDTVRKLQASEHVELYLLLSPAPERNRGLRVRFFAFIAALERTLLAVLGVPVAKREFFELHAAGDNMITLQPPSRSSDAELRYSDADIRLLRSLHLDLIVNGNANGPIKGEMPDVARDGIIDLHHGKPPGFWEVYERRPSTAFVVRRLTGASDGAEVLASGAFRTHRSYTENRQFFCGESSPFMTRLVLDYAAGDELPAPKASAEFAAPLSQTPGIAQSTVYVVRTVAELIAYLVRRKVLRRRERWSVAFTASDWTDAELSAGIEITNPPNHYFADPFVIEKDGRTICYLEDFEYGLERGCITAVELFGDGSYDVLGPVIKESFHMSFPYVFEFENELYMIPETAAAKSIRLYKCINFPLHWEYQHDLMPDVDTVDTLVFPAGDRWWLLTNIASAANGDYCSQLFAFHSNNPLSQDWTPHQQNPVAVDSLTGRNGGLLRDEDGSVIRGRQRQGFNLYGSGLSLAKLDELTPGTYAEREIRAVTADFFPGLIGCHHMHSNGRYTVYDFQRLASRG